jgi:hypothetical protein
MDQIQNLPILKYLEMNLTFQRENNGGKKE